MNQSRWTACKKQASYKQRMQQYTKTILYFATSHVPIIRMQTHEHVIQNCHRSYHLFLPYDDISKPHETEHANAVCRHATLFHHASFRIVSQIIQAPLSRDVSHNNANPLTNCIFWRHRDTYTFSAKPLPTSLFLTRHL